MLEKNKTPQELQAGNNLKPNPPTPDDVNKGRFVRMGHYGFDSDDVEWHITALLKTWKKNDVDMFEDALKTDSDLFVKINNAKPAPDGSYTLQERLSYEVFN